MVHKIGNSNANLKKRGIILIFCDNNLSVQGSFYIAMTINSFPELGDSIFHDYDNILITHNRE